MINIFYEETEILDLDPEFFVSWLTQVCETEDKVLGEVNLIYCSDEHLLGMNKQYLDHDYYTDIITFDNSENDISGDLFISIDRLKDNASANKVPFINELYRVVVHGVLHLIGYDDKLSKDKVEMRSKEDHYLLLIVPRET